MKKLTLVLSILLAIALAACAAPSSGLAGTNWTLTSLDGSTQVGEAAGGAAITLEFGADGHAGGSAGCNNYGSDYTVSDGGISFTAPVSTLMACLDQLVMENEAAYLQALIEIDSYALSGNRLTLTGGEHTLVFSRS